MAVVAVSCLMLSSAALRAADDKDKDKEKDKGWNGVLVDKACSGKFKSEEQAAKEHTKMCAMAEGCAKSGYGLISGEKFLAFDDKGNEKAKEYLKDKKHPMRVHVAGKVSADGKTIAGDEINQKKAEKSEKKEAGKKDAEKKEVEKEESK
jgi:hypothetical protein